MRAPLERRRDVVAVQDPYGAAVGEHLAQREALRVAAARIEQQVLRRAVHHDGCVVPAKVATMLSSTTTCRPAKIGPVLVRIQPGASGEAARAARVGVGTATPEQVAALHDAAPPEFKIAVVLGAGLGLRQAEASGLTVDRIDWFGRAVRIDRQWITKRRTFGPPKTNASDRTIPASASVIAELSKHRADGFVLHRDGAPIDSNAFNWLWRKTLKRAGLAGIRYHDLRHAFASALISGGFSVKACRRRSGTRRRRRRSTSTGICGRATRTASATRWTGLSHRLRAH